MVNVRTVLFTPSLVPLLSSAIRRASSSATRPRTWRLVIEAAEAVGLDLKEARAAYAWLDEAVRHGAAGLDYSALVATILSTAEPTASRA